MTSETCFRVFVDADVLAAPLTRTVLILAGTHPEAAFVPRWSLAVEAEANRHLRPGQTLIDQVRERFDWGSDVIVPTVTSAVARFATTSPKDRHVLATAARAGIAVIVSRNVSDFGQVDLEATQTAVVHPNSFLAKAVTPDIYLDVLTDLASARTREPNTAGSLHAALVAEHPCLHRATQSVFPGVEATLGRHKPPAEGFRGVPFNAGQTRFDHDA
jgi:predicted nucleic acid-binding protein